MAQQTRLLILLAALSFQAASAQEKTLEAPKPIPSATPSVSPQPSATPSLPPKPAVPAPTATPAPKPAASVSPKDEALERQLEKLAPEERQRFKANLERWNKLPKVQQDELRREEKFRSDRILKEINDAIAESGLKLDAQQRQIFTFRYAQERRTIEEDMQKLIEQKRRAAISELIHKLTAEFEPMPPSQPTPDPSPTPQP